MALFGVLFVWSCGMGMSQKAAATGNCFPEMVFTQNSITVSLINNCPDLK